MGWLAKFLAGPAAKAAVKLIQVIAARSKSLSEFRWEVSRAARVGDLDDVFHYVQASDRRRDAWLNKYPKD